jgi:hypothetical protein
MPHCHCSITECQWQCAASGAAVYCHWQWQWRTGAVAVPECTASDTASEWAVAVTWTRTPPTPAELAALPVPVALQWHSRRCQWRRAPASAEYVLVVARRQLPVAECHSGSATGPGTASGLVNSESTASATECQCHYWHWQWTLMSATGTVTGSAVHAPAPPSLRRPRWPRRVAGGHTLAADSLMRPGESESECRSPRRRADGNCQLRCKPWSLIAGRCAMEQ